MDRCVKLGIEIKITAIQTGNLHNGVERMAWITQQEITT